MAEFKIISNSPLDQAPRPLQSLYSESHLPLKVQVYLLPARASAILALLDIYTGLPHPALKLQFENLGQSPRILVNIVQAIFCLPSV